MADPIKVDVRINIKPSVGSVLADVLDELAWARKTFPPFHSAHEGFAVLLEEVDELKAEVWKHPARRSPGAMRREAVQVAAMALRFLFGVC